MVTHTIIVALLAATPAASPEPSAAHEKSAAVQAVAPQRTAQQLRDAVHAAMRRQATTEGAEQQAAVRALAAVYREVTASTSLPQREQRELSTLVRSRLVRTSKALERQLAGARAAAENPPAQPTGRATGVQPPANRTILAQARGNLAGQQPGAAGQRGGAAGGFGPGAQIAGAAQSWNAQTNTNAQELIDLIQNTIAPASWDVNGGLGTIMYFAPAQVLVIRQTSDIHGQVGQAIGGLRRN
jgi:hypothetical protein